MIYFKSVDKRSSLWMAAFVAMATGWLAGTELFLAIFSGAFGSPSL